MPMIARQRAREIRAAGRQGPQPPRAALASRGLRWRRRDRRSGQAPPGSTSAELAVNAPCTPHTRLKKTLTPRSTPLPPSASTLRTWCARLSSGVPPSRLGSSSSTSTVPVPMGAVLDHAPHISARRGRPQERPPPRSRVLAPRNARREPRRSAAVHDEQPGCRSRPAASARALLQS